MKKLSLEVEWFVGILQSEFGVTVGVDDIAVEAVELGLDEVEEVFVPHEVIEELPETLLYEIMVLDEAAGNEWIGTIGFHVDSPEWCIQIITKNGQMTYREYHWKGELKMDVEQRLAQVLMKKLRQYVSTASIHGEVNDYVNWFNNIRIHGTLGYKSPVEYGLQTL